MEEQRRAGDFVEKLSLRIAYGAFIGGFIVLLDPKLTLVVFSQTIQIGSGFAAEVKGMVLQSMLISGLAGVMAYWLGTTKQGQDQARAVNRIAEAAAPSTAAAVLASKPDVSAGAALAADDVTIKAAGTVNVNPDKDPKS